MKSFEAEARQIIERETDLFAAPDVGESFVVDAHRTLSLAAFVPMTLIAFRHKDQMHLLDMLDVVLSDASYVAELTPEPAGRLHHLLNYPERQSSRRFPAFSDRSA